MLQTEHFIHHSMCMPEDEPDNYKGYKFDFKRQEAINSLQPIFERHQALTRLYDLMVCDSLYLYHNQ